ncbi:MAG: hypothetical protein HXS40_06670 [Theionarchaea archaeon]|nr:hypothetical protein [Theionarchaea archaeon]
MNSVLCSAIHQKLLLTFVYGGPRTAEPYCYGVSAAGRELLRAYQVEGYSESDNPQGWKLFHVAKMMNLHVSDISFAGTRPEYNPRDPAMEVIYYSLEVDRK